MNRLPALIAVCLAIWSASARAADWQLVWSDELHYTGLPDPKKWSYDVGYCRNNEPQYYTDKRPENLRVENGEMIFEARKEAIPNPGYVPGSTNFKHAQFTKYTSANVTTEGKFEFCYGRLEIVAQIPSGSGMWPAFWTVGADGRKIGWPACGEIDVMEYFGADKNFIKGTLHYGSKHNSLSTQGKQPIVAPLQGFHTYAAEWFPDRIDMYFDDHKYFTFPVDTAGLGPNNPFRKPHYILLNLALGSNPSAGKVDESLLPARFVIKSVRVYRDAATTQPTTKPLK